MADAITIKALQDASLDAKSLEDVVNGDDARQVTTRLGETYPSVKKAIKMLFENGGIAARFKTVEQLQVEGVDLSEGAYALVADDTDDENGIYIKESGAWVKSKYNISDVAKNQALSILSDVISFSKNLLDPSETEYGKAMSATGEISESGEYALSGFIKVRPDSKYSLYSTSDILKPIQAVHYFDADKQFLSRASVTLLAKTTITTTKNTHYMRLNILADALPNLISVTEGDEFLDYKAHNPPFVKPSALPESVVKKEYLGRFIEPPVNLYDKTKDINGYINKIGVIITSSNDILTDYIAVEPNGVYSSTHNNALGATFNYIAYYNKDKGFVARVRKINTGPHEKEVYTIPSGVYYVRLMMPVTDDSHIRVFVKGDGADISSNSNYTLKNVDIHSGVVEKIKDETVGLYFKESPNLFDYNKVTPGKYIAIDGSIGDSTTYNISEFIPVDSSSVYTQTWNWPLGQPFIHTVAYTKDKEFIARYSTGGTGEHIPRQLTLPKSAAYVRLNINSLDPNRYYPMFVKGTDVPNDYIDGKPVLSGVNLGNDVISQLRSKVEGYVSDANFDLNYSFAGDSSGFTGVESMSAADIYSLFDGLYTDNRDYIKKEFLGNDSWDNPISLYRLRSPEIMSTAPQRPKPKILIIGGTHGFEKTPPIALYLMVKELCESWRTDDALDAIRFNAELLIIPISNPSGWNSNTRKNDNGVDIARSFPEGFGWQSTDPESPYYGGAEPLQEPESQYISSVIKNNDLDGCYDFHSFGGNGHNGRYLWVSAEDNEIAANFGDAIIARLGRKWVKEYSWLPDDYSAGSISTTSDYRRAMITSHATGNGVPLSSVLEVSARWWVNPNAVTFDAIHMKTATEVIVNWTLINLKYLSR